MDKIKKVDSVSQFNAKRGQQTLHPLVSVLDQSKSTLIQPARQLSELYIIFLKDAKCSPLQYGRNQYDYQDETLLFIAPGQVFGFDEDVDTLQPNGWALAFHPDLLRGTSLGKHIKDYDFFSYDVNEALHISDRERQLVLECFQKIQYELDHPIDKHSRTLIVSAIELFLNYCVRFYDRQFITREHLNKDVLVRFEELLDTYFDSDKPQTLGLPSVGYCADQLNLSANYFGELVKKETGKSAKDYIHTKVIEVAKEKVFDASKSISEVAYNMGFKYPQHFTRLFKQHVGQSPNEYRMASN
ncbi:helix-turn-helix domain-containing protein [Spirosoma pollinicola]|uniref:AraC family transcriptional regulator n=1 Tax=Spirosoma pollinicola TaxID=2057025 RepID=A0A2K8YUZ3_9BACT|nr:helix-turn-helix domain-containing protein [Spirosoma pollinicola]AUD01394.1 AraC family transcriptional regulator [Spirosoma pollinicola]